MLTIECSGFRAVTMPTRDEIAALTSTVLPTLQRQAAGQRGDQEGPGKGSVGIGQKLADLAGQATKGPGGAGGNQVCGWFHQRITSTCWRF
jgi:hypothetical protein